MRTLASVGMPTNFAKLRQSILRLLSRHAAHERAKRPQFGQFMFGVAITDGGGWPWCCAYDSRNAGNVGTAARIIFAGHPFDDLDVAG